MVGARVTAPRRSVNGSRKATTAAASIGPVRQPGVIGIAEQLTLDFDEEGKGFKTETVPDPSKSPLESLAAVDWDFPQRTVQNDLEGIHPYPAKFIAEIPRALLESLPIAPDTAVLDPFSGSGTTLVECQRRGIPTIGIDLNPIACLITRVKTAPYPGDLTLHAICAIERAKAQPATSIPVIPNLDHWFKPEIQKQLASLLTAIDSVPSEARDCLQLAVSSIIVRVSNQESDTRYAAIQKQVAPQAVSSLFLRAVERIESALRTRHYPLSPTRMIEGNTLNVAADEISEPVGLVITSPPYPNAYEYWLYHKYRMWWLGFDPLSVKEQEIGARAHFFKKNPHTAKDFSRQMRQTFALLDRVVVPGGHVCFVVGRSQIHAQIIDNAQIVDEAGVGYGFDRYFSAERVIAAHRKSFNLSHANIKNETILVLRKASS